MSKQCKIIIVCGKDTLLSKQFASKRSIAAIVYIRAVFNDGTRVNIEIQLINQYNMDKRTLFYWAKMFAEQLKPGNKFSELKRTITINLLAF